VALGQPGPEPALDGFFKEACSAWRASRWTGVCRTRSGMAIRQTMRAFRFGAVSGGQCQIGFHRLFEPSSALRSNDGAASAMSGECRCSPRRRRGEFRAFISASLKSVLRP
jgi:hypothetical protein